MKTRAAVAFEAKRPLEVVELDLEGPRAGEVLVEVMATGICHTDAYTLDGLDSEGLFPSVLGHEGAGVVREVGAGVTSVAVGDHVIPLYTLECRQCKSCLSGKINLCTAIRATQGRGLMPTERPGSATRGNRSTTIWAAAVEPLLAAGAEGGNGLAVDAQCRTSLPDVYALGDCALYASAFADGAQLRLESVQNANDMAATVVKAITGAPEAYQAVPWFWSNQYDLKLQTVGLSAGHDTAITRGDPATRSFSVVYLRRGRVTALDCVNAVKDYVQGRALVTSAVKAEPECLADTATPLKDLVVAQDGVPA